MYNLFIFKCTFYYLSFLENYILSHKLKIKAELEFLNIVHIYRRVL